MPKLYGSAPAWGLGDLSPFVMKVMVWLDLKEIPYTRRAGDPRKSPKGKVPWWVEDDGTVIADSSDILRHLSARHGPLPGDAAAPPDRGPTHLLRRTFEESLYFALAWARWSPESNLPALMDGFRPLLPPVIGGLILRRVIRPQVLRSCRMQGIGRHTPEQIAARAIEDLTAISEVLGEQPWFAGDQPGTIDATAWAFLASIAWPDFPSAPRDALRADTRLMAYLERGRPRMKTAIVADLTTA